MAVVLRRSLTVGGIVPRTWGGVKGLNGGKLLVRHTHGEAWRTLRHC
jgi:hypothetical protein